MKKDLLMAQKNIFIQMEKKKPCISMEQFKKLMKIKLKQYFMQMDKKFLI